MGLDTSSVNLKNRSAPKDVVDLKNLYWLASGFFPQFDTASKVVICLQDPSLDIAVDKSGYGSDTSVYSDRSLISPARSDTTDKSTQEARSILSSTFTDSYEGEP
jgi:hypothetical protein